MSTLKIACFFLTPLMWRNDIPFDIDQSDIVFPDKCPVLGITMSRYDGSFGSSPSIDRVDPDKGYVKGNICVISSRANKLKSNGTIAEIRAVLKYMEKMDADKR